MNDFSFWIVMLCAFGYAYITAKVFWGLYNERRWRGVALSGVLLISVIPAALTVIRFINQG